MKKTAWMAICFLFIFSYTIVSFAQGQDLENLKCRAFILIDSASGQVLFEKNSNERLNPASTTKIMTGLLALEYGDLNRKFVASRDAVNDIGRGGMNIAIKEGEEIRLEDLLNALLVRSANETANIIAENIAPSREEFVLLMNTRAKELGATNTTFVNTCGKDTDPQDKGHLTTASDLSKIARQAMTLPKFREIVKKKLVKIPVTNMMNQERYLGSTNKLLWSTYKSSHYAEVTGIKTGYTDKAGQNLISSAMDKDGNELIAVIMGVYNDNIFQMSKTLLEYGFKNFSALKLDEENTFYKSVTFASPNNRTIDLIIVNAPKIMFPDDNLKSGWNITKTEYIPTNPFAQINKGDRVGYLEYFINGKSVGKGDLVSNTPLLNEPGKMNAQNPPSNFTKVIKIILIVLLSLLGLLFLSRLLMPILRRRHASKSRPKKDNLYDLSLARTKIREQETRKEPTLTNFKNYKS